MIVGDLNGAEGGSVAESVVGKFGSLVNEL